jgi:hypothetical protein
MFLDWGKLLFWSHPTAGQQHHPLMNSHIRAFFGDSSEEQHGIKPSGCGNM